MLLKGRESKGLGQQLCKLAGMAGWVEQHVRAWRLPAGCRPQPYPHAGMGSGCCSCSSLASLHDYAHEKRAIVGVLLAWGPGGYISIQRSPMRKTVPDKDSYAHLTSQQKPSNCRSQIDKGFCTLLT